jgi:hypothetical protein
VTARNRASLDLAPKPGQEVAARIIYPARPEAFTAITAQFTAEELITKRTQVRAPISALGAERLAKDQNCAAQPSATLLAKGPGFETYSVACSNGDVLMVRCEFGKCRALK